MRVKVVPQAVVLTTRTCPLPMTVKKKMHYNAMRGLSVVGPESSLLCGVWCCWLVVSFLERDRLEVLRAELGELRVRGRKVLEEEVLIGRVHLDVLAPRLVLQRREKRMGGMVVVLCVPLAADAVLLRGPEGEQCRSAASSACPTGPQTASAPTTP